MRSALADEMRCASQALAGLAAGERLDHALELAGREHALAPASRPVVRDLAYHAARTWGLCRELARLLNAREPVPAVAALQWLALSQLIDPQRHPATIVDQAVRAARDDPLTAGASGFINATLRTFLRDAPQWLDRARKAPEARWNHPPWWIDVLQADHPQAWQSIAESADRHPPLTLRINPRRTDLPAYLDRLQAAGFSARVVGPQAVIVEPACPVHSLPGWAEGWVSVQDEGAQRAARWLDVQDGHRVLDACAAPGGKSAHLLELFDIRLTALDLKRKRLAQVGEGLARLGLQATLVCGDAADPARWWTGERFDRILVDAPCTASGIVRRAPDARWLRRRGDLATLAAAQRRIVEALWPLLEPGGKLLYVTCSVFKAEGPQVIQSFLRGHPDARELALQEGPPQGAAAHGAEPGLQMLPTASPSEDHDGFFYCLIEKLRP